ncbi:hypothetical protein [Dyella flagellata]|uniref:Uncharacterized protein n=1 Tax=Dyella flagellata TaxID=1867833 RepID=A0ABQ5XJU1_9GAMM|nr:hypothetical protein [Dyella flagellata]GLQ90793.1 hypothetical protein GCM10007898_43690 [Dyella flagellata]
MSTYEKGRVRAGRPDVTINARLAAAALAHDQWFREQVDIALTEEASGQATWHPHDQVWAELEAETARLVREREAGQDSSQRRDLRKRKAKPASHSGVKKRA